MRRSAPGELILGVTAPRCDGMTEPEDALLRRTASTAQHLEAEQGAPPSLLSLLRRMREPPTRRGLARILAMLHSVGEPGRPPTNSNS